MENLAHFLLGLHILPPFSNKLCKEKRNPLIGTAEFTEDAKISEISAFSASSAVLNWPV